MKVSYVKYITTTNIFEPHPAVIIKPPQTMVLCDDTSMFLKTPVVNFDVIDLIRGSGIPHQTEIYSIDEANCQGISNELFKILKKHRVCSGSVYDRNGKKVAHAFDCTLIFSNGEFQKYKLVDCMGSFKMLLCSVFDAEFFTHLINDQPEFL